MVGVPKGFRPPVRARNRPLDCGGLVSDPVSGISRGLASPTGFTRAYIEGPLAA